MQVHKRDDLHLICTKWLYKSMVLVRKLEDGESSDKVLSWRAAIKQVTWQLLSNVLFSVYVAQQS